MSSSSPDITTCFLLMLNLRDTSHWMSSCIVRLQCYLNRLVSTYVYSCFILPVTVLWRSQYVNMPQGEWSWDDLFTFECAGFFNTSESCNICESLPSKSLPKIIFKRQTFNIFMYIHVHSCNDYHCEIAQLYTCKFWWQIWISGIDPTNPDIFKLFPVHCHTCCIETSDWLPFWTAFSALAPFWYSQDHISAASCCAPIFLSASLT